MKALFAGFALAITACAHGNSGRSCRENPAFQRAFFHHVDVVETYTRERNTGAEVYTLGPDEMLDSMAFLETYTAVPMGPVLNYEVGYANMELFLKDKKRWLRWYDAHKCANLQPDK